MTDAPVLRATDLWAGYAGPNVLRGVSLDLIPGSAPVGIVGPSGVGKSTIVRALRGSVKPTRGQVTFQGRTVSKLGRRDKKSFQALVRTVGQNGLLIRDPRATVERFVKEALSDARKAGRANGRPMEEILADVALEPRYIRRTVQSMSGGERQRLALALALTTRPQILLLDEPLTALDPAMRGDIVRRLSDVIAEQGTAVLLVSHDLELVERLCPSVHVLADGQFVASGSMRDVLAQAEHPVVRDLAEAAPQAVQRFR